MEVEDGACGDVDVVIGGEQGDQANHDAGEHLDPALEIETAAASRRGLDVRQVWRRFVSRIGFGRGIGLRQGPAASSRQHSTPVRSGDPAVVGLGVSAGAGGRLCVGVALRRGCRIPPAERSRLGLVWCGGGWARVGGGAEQDHIKLGVQLGEPRVSCHCVMPAWSVDDLWPRSPSRLRELPLKDGGMDSAGHGEGSVGDHVALEEAATGLHGHGACGRRYQGQASGGAGG